MAKRKNHKTTAGEIPVIDHKTKIALINTIKSRIQNTIQELAKLQRERDEESLIRLSDLSQQRDRLFEKLEAITQSKNFDQNFKLAHTKNKTNVNLGDSVVIKNRQEKRKLNIVGHYEADSAQGRISANSPLGKGLLNKSRGDKVGIQTPAGTEEYEILAIQ